ncbi:Urease accessory protein UreD [Gordonia neofelifaecis NRRL B-59395]|uniref:Urease accessory protein UreD n=1 Tax=Gordonia neofelifaecis NRRL B-59395 TaxID=644548 RepID=F1YNE3_9ACTN|nr:Urease accessory protein UreD [Gordonia neofelifaecis NRRL B-59395]
MLGQSGELRLTLAPRRGRTVAVGQFHEGALQTLRPMYLDDSGQVCYLIVNPGGACMRGDRYRIEVELETDARLLLTTQSATKVYRTPEAYAEQRMDVRLGPGSVLEYVPDPLILYREADFRQYGTVEMDASATLVMSEIVTPGWAPGGRLFAYERLRMRNEIRYDGRLLAIDNLVVTPGEAGPGGLGFMEGHTHLGSLIVVDSRVDDGLIDDIHEIIEAHAGTVVAGLSALDGPGFVIRALADDTAELRAVLDEVTASLRARWFGLAPVNLRKY